MEELLWNIKIGRYFMEIGWGKRLIWKYRWDKYEALLHIGKLRIWFLFLRHKFED